MKNGVMIDLATMSVVSPNDYLHFNAGYENGYRDGIDRGLQIAHEQDQREWQNMRAFIRGRANNLSYAELAERRGEPAKAQRQREILAVNGVGL